jgi:hypothetical protein
MDSNKIASELVKTAKELVADRSGEKLPVKFIVTKNNVAQELLKVARELVALSVGDTIENGNIRIHRFRDSIRMWDLTNAGKSGKSVDYFWASDFDYLPEHSEYDVELMMKNLGKVDDYRDAVGLVKRFSDFANDQVGQKVVDYGESKKRGVDITPAGFKPIVIKGKYVIIDADYDSFSVADRVDQNNLPTCIPAVNGGKKDIKLFYRWVQDNQSKINNMTFSQVIDQMSKNGIRYHYYCAMD